MSDADVLAGLAAEDAGQRALTLRALQVAPVRDERVIAALEGLLADTSAALLAQPPTFGEVRTLAAQVLQAHRRAMGIETAVVVRDAGPMLSIGQLLDLAQQAGVPYDGGLEDGPEVYEALALRGVLPRRDLALSD